MKINTQKHTSSHIHTDTPADDISHADSPKTEEATTEVHAAPDSFRATGALGILSGSVETVAGFGALMVMPLAGLPIMMHGLDATRVGVMELITGNDHDSLTQKAMMASGMDEERAQKIDSRITTVSSLGVGGITSLAAGLAPVALAALAAAQTGTLTLLGNEE